MPLQEYDLVEIIRDPGVWIYETSELTNDGHYYLYQYDAAERLFYRATVPAGAAAVHFFPLKPKDKVPIGGWTPVERKRSPKFRPRLVTERTLA